MIKVSIISPSLNSASVIGDCIRSVDQQNHVHEHIIVDGHSSDGTLEVVRSIDRKLYTELHVVQDAPEGIYAAINAGIQASQGDIIGVLHADDFYASTDVLNQVAAVFEDEAVDACYGDLLYVNGDDPSHIVRYWRTGEYREGRFLHGWMPPHPTFFVRKKVYEQFGVYRTDLGTSADYELMVRMMVKHRVKTAYIPHILVHMRTGGLSNISLTARLKANRMDRHSWRVNNLRPYPWTILAKPTRKLMQWWLRPDQTETKP
jgi:glycosyltransferase